MSLSCSRVSDVCPDVSNKCRSLWSVRLALESRAHIWIVRRYNSVPNGASSFQRATKLTVTLRRICIKLWRRQTGKVLGALMCLLFCLPVFFFDSSHRWQNKAAPEDTTPAVVLVMALGARNIAGCKSLKGPSRWISVAWRSTLF